ncbi:MAG TPA: integrase core domain-containing protein, partial [bacterium]|nr:integrase core domain-containing protein [bacterium]
CRDVGIEHRRTKPRHAWTNGFVERLQGTILTALWRVAFRRTYYTSTGQLERDLQAYLRCYNWERPHQGYRLRGRTPASVFIPKVAS